MLWVIVLHEYKSLTHKPRLRWDHVMLQFAVIVDLIQFVLHLVQIPEFDIGKSPPPLEPPPYFTIDVIQGVAALSPTLRRTQTLQFKPKISNFNSSVQRTLFHCSVVQSLRALAHRGLLTLFCFLNSCFLTVTLIYRPASPSFRFTVDVDIFFSQH